MTKCDVQVRNDQPDDNDCNDVKIYGKETQETAAVGVHGVQ